MNTDVHFNSREAYNIFLIEANMKSWVYFYVTWIKDITGEFFLWPFTYGLAHLLSTIRWPTP